MSRTNLNNVRLSKKALRNHRLDSQRPPLARATLVAGGGFTTAIATILGAAGRWNLAPGLVLAALGGLCVVVALTLFLVAYLMRS